MKTQSFPRAVGFALALALLVSGGAWAQSQAGNLYGSVADDQGSALPGVTVTVSGGGAPSTQVTDAQGRFRFLGLGPGNYEIKAELDGFSPIEYPNAIVNVGRNTEIQLTMNSAVKEVITVTTESPLIDQRRHTVSTSLTTTELESVPNARDPWAVLQQTPGVLTDRINVGGNESGQQSNYVGPGAQDFNSVWSLDGMVVTDMSATGSSPGYFDFDAFEEMQVTTGGSDASMATPGVTLNMVTKRGTNEWRGSGRFLFENDSMQSESSIDASEFAKPGPWRTGVGLLNGQASFKRGNRIDTIEDWGLELGGPLVKDRFWIWGSYAKPKIDLLTVSDFTDSTTLEDWNFKLNGQLTPANSMSAFAWQSDKVKIGRNAGPLRPQETTWDQSKFGPDPTAYKVEDTHVFGPNFYLSGMYSVVNGGFQLVPEGGDVVPVLDPGGAWHNSFFLIEIGRPQEQLKTDGSSFFTTGNLSHELRFGAGYRTAEQRTFSRTQGGAYEQQLGGGESTYALGRDEQLNAEAQYTNLYVQDTFSVGNLTANFGLRYDIQGGDNLAASVSANRYRPDLLPAVNYGGGDAGFEWKTLTPRLGLTYAFGAEKKTLLRASFSQFADQLGTGTVAQLNPLALQAYAYFYYRASSGSSVLNPARVAGAPDNYSGNTNPFNGGLLQSNAVAKNLNAPLTNEVLLSLEHSLRPELVVALNLSYRKYTDILEFERLVFDCGGVRQDCAYSLANMNSVGRANRASDYQRSFNLAGTDPRGNTYSSPVWDLVPGVASRNGTLMENGDREQDYKGASLIMTKRLSNRWMMRGNLSFSDWKWKVPASEEEDPTRVLPNGFNGADGDPVLFGSGTASGSKGSVFINSKWSYAINGMYQVVPDRPWGFNLGATLSGRQGYPTVYFRRTFGRSIPDGAFGLNVAANSESDRYRYDDIQTIDLRVEKEFNFSDFGLTLGVDMFNVLNESFVLQRVGRLNRTNSNDVLEVLSPRVFRVGARFSMR